MEAQLGATAYGAEPSENEWYDDWEESDDLLRKNTYSKKLVNGINIKDLCDGKEVIFEISKDDPKNATESDDDVSEDISHYDFEKLRNKQFVAFLNQSFEELASTMTNVTEDGLVKKQVIISGIGKIVPDHAYVTVHYNLYQEKYEEPFDSTYLRNRPERFRLDQGEAILGLEYAVKSMKKRENSMFFIKWEVAFGALGCPDRIGKKCDIIADITLVNFVEIDAEHDLKSSSTDIGKTDFTKFLNEAKRFLCIGSDDFSRGEIRPAVTSYRKALKILNSLWLADENEESQMLNLKVKCLVNLAVCYNKLGQPEQACRVCQEALSINNFHVKANFHYGRACIALSNFKMAKRYLFKAAKLKPNDVDISKEIKKLNDKEALYELKDKMFWKKAIDCKEEEKKGESSPLESFEKSLKNSLEECITDK